jgi:putative aldouronate transport system substrate-binding protein
MTESIDRRGFLRGAAGTAALAAGGGSLLTACGGTAAKKNSNDANKKVKLPTLHPFNSVKPDLPGDPTLGVQDAYLSYPAHPVKGIKEKPGKGGSVTAFVITYTDPPPGLGKNKYWQALNARLGTKLNMTIVPFSDYVQKLATTIAGGDLPDYLQIYQPVPQLPSLLAAKCQDLTKYLSGDAVKDYPYLASIPSDYWKSCVFNGGIYGLPIPRSKMGGMLYRRDDLIKPKGVNPNPTSFAEFTSLCKELTDLRHNKWALASAPNDFVRQMLGACRTWKNDGGKLTNINEQPETKQAIGAVASLVKAGYVHPDSFAQNNTTTLKQWFSSGTALMHFDNYTAWPGFYTQNVAGASFTINGMLPPNFDSGSKANTWQGSLDFSFTALKKSSDSRIKELLAIANYIAAPFGTEESTFMGNGVLGVDYTIKNGLPVKTDQGTAEVQLSTGYLAQGPSVLAGQYTQATKDCYEYEKKFLPQSVADPTQALYSDTASSKNATLNQAITDATNAILQGRKPLSSWDDAVQAWKSGGGDQIRKEFQEALQKSS